MGLALCGSARAADHYVDCDAAPGGSGTENQPWSAIALATKSNGPVTDGDTVNLRGTCTTGVRFTDADSGARDAPITYRRWPGEVFVLQGEDYHSGVEVRGSNLVLDGWEVVGWSQGVSFDGANDALAVTIRGCRVHGSSSGITTGTGTVRELAIVDCELYDNGFNVVVGACQAATIRGNDIHGAWNVGLKIESRSGDGWGTDSVLVAGNRIHDNAHGGVEVTDQYMVDDQVTHLLVRNNLLWGNTGFGLQLTRQNAHNRIYNNTFHAHEGTSISVIGGSETLVIANNLSWQATQEETGTATFTTNFTGDPAFASVDPSAPGFLQLTPQSPARDMGTDLSPDVIDDYFGTARQAPYDAGAHEYTDERPVTATLEVAGPDATTVPWGAREALALELRVAATEGRVVLRGIRFEVEGDAVVARGQIRHLEADAGEGSDGLDLGSVEIDGTALLFAGLTADLEEGDRLQLRVELVDKRDFAGTAGALGVPRSGRGVLLLAVCALLIAIVAGLGAAAPRGRRANPLWALGFAALLLITATLGCRDYLSWVKAEFSVSVLDADHVSLDRGAAAGPPLEGPRVAVEGSEVPPR